MARLMGIRLLAVDATVVLVPADVRASGGPPPSAGGAGGGLAEAVRRIDEGVEVLAEARRASAHSKPKGV